MATTMSPMISWELLPRVTAGSSWASIFSRAMSAVESWPTSFAVYSSSVWVVTVMVLACSTT